jgi:glucose dehydrogenase/DNA uptake protein ComE-like DNA-binding protein/plastocyanin
MKGNLLASMLLASGILLASQTYAQSCCEPTIKDFPKVGGNYGNQNYSSLARVNKGNIAELGAAWHDHLEGGSTKEFQQATAVAVDGFLYVETTQGRVFAVNGKTGEIKWTFDPGYGTQLRRGVAVGGGKVFTNMAGHRVVALDQATGKLIWEKQLLDEGPIGTLRSAVTYYDGMIYFGSCDGPRDVGIAMDANTGNIVWKFHAAPAPGEFGHDTWGEGDAWQTGGAAPWMHPAIDPELGLVYWTFGNARGGGAVDGSTRPGQNLFADSLIAFDAKTGRRVWYFQSVHHDIWDMDNVMAPLLIDIKIGGKTRKAIVYGSKTGMFYILDRTNGTPLTPIDERPVPQEPLQKTWPTQPYPEGDALVPTCPTTTGAGQPPPNFKVGCLFTPHLYQLVVQTPGTGGGADWSAMSYDPRTHLIYTGAGIVSTAHSLSDHGVFFRPLGEQRSGKIVAFDPATHKIVWQRDEKWALAHGNGVLTTAGDVMFVGQPDGFLLGLDIKDGHELWRFQTGAGVHSSPISYEIDGEQYIAVFAGGSRIPYNSPRGDNLWAFKLGGRVAQAATPTPPSSRQPIDAAAVDGAAAKNTVYLARAWREGSPGNVESTLPNSMAPQNMRVPVGTTVTFLNPSGNTTAHCATQFYEGLFDSGPLQPGQSFAFTFTRPGEYFYNDCTSPGTTGKVVVSVSSVPGPARVEDAPAQAPGPSIASVSILPDSTGKTEVINTCSQCHSLDVLTSKRQTKEEWAETVNQMQERGAQATDDQVELIVNYLAAHFGKLIHINEAPVETLEDALAMTPQEAAALVKYRQENGNFKNLDALLKMPGVDTKKIQEQSGNIVFDAKVP